jgi:tripartite-type tricarboxylate transporter receptor subunit TctC
MNLPLRRSLAIMTALVLFTVPARSQDAYPNRAVKIIAPVAPGTVADLVPRLIADKLAGRWGQAVIVENRPGGGTNIGTEAAFRAIADGYTLLAAPATPLVVNQSLYPKLAFDPTAFEPITVFADQPNVLVARSSLPAKTVGELLSYAKANPGKLTFASSGTGTLQHLDMEQIKRLTGIQAIHVPYRGLAPALNDLVAGHVDVMIDNLGTSAPQMKQGTIKGIAVGSAARIPQFPDLPTLSESIPGLESRTWFALVAPPRTPHDMIVKLQADVAAVLQLADVRERLHELYASPIASSPEATGAFFTKERKRWRDVIQSAGIKLE